MTSFTNIPERAALSRAVPIEFVAEYRGCSTYEIRRLKRLGQMPAPLKTGGRRLYWRLSDVVAWVDGMATHSEVAA
ncbi:putative DNA-binding transcriptional regulator AlpA [Bradyrhizobium sp. GM7.3]